MTVDRLVLSISAGSQADEQELAELTRNLRADLLDTSVESIEQIRAATAPVGAKGDAGSLASIAVTLLPAAVTGLIAVLHSWLARHDRTSITLQKGNHTITVTGTLSDDQQRLIADWLGTGKRP